MTTRINMTGSLSNLPEAVCDCIRAFLPFDDLHKKKTNITAIAIAQLPKEKPSTPYAYVSKLLESANVLLSCDVNLNHSKLREVEENLKALTYEEAVTLYANAERKLREPDVTLSAYKAEQKAIKRYEKLLKHVFKSANSVELARLMNWGYTPDYYELLYPIAIEKKIIDFSKREQIDAFLKMIQKKSFNKRNCVKLPEIDSLLQMGYTTDHFERLYPYAHEKKVIVLNTPEKFTAFFKMVRKKSFNLRICVQIPQPNLNLLQQIKEVANPEFVRVDLGKRNVDLWPQGLVSEWIAAVALGIIFIGGALAASIFGFYQLYFYSYPSFFVTIFLTGMLGLLPVTVPIAAGTGLLALCGYINDTLRINRENQFAKRHLQKFIFNPRT